MSFWVWWTQTFKQADLCREDMKQLQEDYKDLEDEKEDLELELTSLKHRYSKVIDAHHELAVKHEEASGILDLIPPEFFPTELDAYMDAHYERIDNIAYKQKRSIDGKYISMYLQELITPSAWEVVNYRRKLKVRGDTFMDAKVAGDALAKDVTWVTDEIRDKKTKDVYLYPNEVLVSGEDDCEGHSFTISSINYRIGVAYGFYKMNNGEKGGHAFNVFVYNGELYIMDTVGNKAFIEKYDGSDRYEIYYVITLAGTWRLRRGVNFGYIARWY